MSYGDDSLQVLNLNELDLIGCWHEKVNWSPEFKDSEAHELIGKVDGGGQDILSRGLFLAVPWRDGLAGVRLPSGAEAPISWGLFSARLNPCPFTRRRLGRGTTR